MFRIVVNVSLLTIIAIYVTATNVSAQMANKVAGTQYIQIVSLSDSALVSHSVPDGDRSQANKPLLAKDYNEQGVTYSKQGQYDLAILEFNKALEIDPTSTDAYNNRGITYSKKGQYNSAISDFSKALEIEPKDTKILYNRGITHAIEGQFDLALSDLSKCLELSPSNADAYDFRGIIYEGLACLDWVQACKFGSCDKLNEAKRAGLCSDLSIINNM